MSFFGKFLGGDRSNAYAEGVALLEEGRFADAADRLRFAALGRGDSASGSLASYHFRQALVSEGRRLMRQGQFSNSLEFLGEAVRLWDLYPDLHCLHGAALAQTGQWAQALQEARFALRLNADYVEARLLESTVLKNLNRNAEAADSLNSLQESGRRVDHWLIQQFECPDQYGPDNLPEDLMAHLVKSLSGESEKEEVASAVALCREGKWLEGLEIFADLVQRRPRYPDYRTRHAAALFQVGRADEALEEVEAALALNETYRTAIDLKGLVLADTGRLVQARDFLQKADETQADTSRVGAHEELFGSYLRGVLALLTGDPEGVLKILEGWPDLLRHFARAELLLAAADDLRGRTTTCGRRLADLADEWPAEEIYFDLLACHHLGKQRFRDTSGVLSRWPAEERGSDSHLFLETLLILCQGEKTVVIDQNEKTESDAWSYLKARAAFQAGDDEKAWTLCQKLFDKGVESEKLARLQIAAAAGKPNMANLDDSHWKPPRVHADSCLAQTYYFEMGRGRSELALDLVQGVLALHPEHLTARWLLPSFWLGPIRAWIA